MPARIANHAVVLMEQNRLGEAKAELDRALTLDPGLSFAHAYIGQHAIHSGDFDGALNALLESSAVNPAYAEGLLLLAAVHYRRGEYALALQQIDNADRLNPASATPALFRAAIAIDRYDLDTAIISAREALRRYRAKGGIYARLSENRGTGSYIAGAFRFLELNDWGRYYGDRVFDRFTASAYFDQANSGAAQPFLAEQTSTPFDPRAFIFDQFSSLLQGLALQPLSIAASERNLQLFRERFVEGSVRGSTTAANGDVRGAITAGAQGLAFEPLPLAINIAATRSSNHGPFGETNDADSKSITALIGAEITPYDRLVLVGQAAENRREFPVDNSGLVLTRDGRQRSNLEALYGVYAHEFGYRNILTLGGFFANSRSQFDRRDELMLGGVSLFQATTGIEHRADIWSVGGNWAVDLATVDVAIGLEASGRKERQTQALEFRSPFDDGGFETAGRASTDQQRYYLNVRAEPVPGVALEAMAVATDMDRTRFDWRLGAAVEPREGHWLRAAYLKEAASPNPFTLAPTRVVGLIANAAPLPSEGRLESAIARWDAEWFSQVFTSVEYQHQEYSALHFARPDVIAPFSPAGPLGPASFDYGSAALDRVAVSGNLWLKGNVGLNVHYARSWSRLDSEGGAIPFLPKDYARAGVSWTHPMRLKLNAGLSYIGKRRSEALQTRLDDYWSLDAGLNWQSPDKRLQFDLSASNLLDADYEIMTGLPGWGRTVTATLTLRL